MERIVKIIDELRETSSSNEKQLILEKNKDNKLLKKILEYTYNPFKKYGLTEKVFGEKGESASKHIIGELDGLVGKLAISNINDSLRDEAREFVDSFPDEQREILICILCKDLKIGMKSQSINKIFKGLIPQFNVQLATALDKVKLGGDEEIWITTKLDGIRCVAIFDFATNKYKFFSRNGKEILGMQQLETDLNFFRNKNDIYKDVIFDGELILKNEKGLISSELYRETVSVVNSKMEEKLNVEFHIFDIIKLQEFQLGKSSDDYSERRTALDQLENTEYVKIVQVLYNGVDHSVVPDLLVEVEKLGCEGLMINLDKPYVCKRTKDLIKVKSFNNADVRVIDVIPGTGKYAGKLGAVLVEFEYEDKIYNCEVGSGFSDQERKELFLNQYDIINRIIEINYFEISKNKNGGVSLRFPTFKQVRYDKNEISMH